jgi:hypothetical protein
MRPVGPVSGAHAGLPVPSDVWLTDQLAAWQHDADAYVAQALAQLREVSGSKTVEQLTAELMERDSAKTRLLCTARQLVAEVLRRG